MEKFRVGLFFFKIEQKFNSYAHQNFSERQVTLHLPCRKRHVRNKHNQVILKEATLRKWSSFEERHHFTRHCLFTFFQLYPEFFPPPYSFSMYLSNCLAIMFLLYDHTQYISLLPLLVVLYALALCSLLQPIPDLSLAVCCDTCTRTHM